MNSTLTYQYPPLHYLASPYNHPDPEVMEARRAAACLKAGELIAAGVAVISPIAHNVAVIREVGGETGWDRWQVQDMAILRACKKMLVLRLPGWEESKGVAAEISAAQKIGMPIDYLDPDVDVTAWKSAQPNWLNVLTPLPADVADVFNQG